MRTKAQLLEALSLLSGVSVLKCADVWAAVKRIQQCRGGFKCSFIEYRKLVRSNRTFRIRCVLEYRKNGRQCIVAAESINPILAFTRAYRLMLKDTK